MFFDDIEKFFNECKRQLYICDIILDRVYAAQKSYGQNVQLKITLTKKMAETFYKGLGLLSDSEFKILNSVKYDLIDSEKLRCFVEVIDEK